MGTACGAEEKIQKDSEAEGWEEGEKEERDGALSFKSRVEERMSDEIVRVVTVTEVNWHGRTGMNLKETEFPQAGDVNRRHAFAAVTRLH